MPAVHDQRVAFHILPLVHDQRVAAHATANGKVRRAHVGAPPCGRRQVAHTF